MKIKYIIFLLVITLLFNFVHASDTTEVSNDIILYRQHNHNYHYVEDPKTKILNQVKIASIFDGNCKYFKLKKEDDKHHIYADCYTDAGQYTGGTQIGQLTLSDLGKLCNINGVLAKGKNCVKHLDLIFMIQVNR